VPLHVLGVVAAVVLMLWSIAPSARAQTAPFTYSDFSYNKTTTVEPPTADKPQSKLWRHDGSWWALMVSPADRTVHVFELTPTHTWRDTGAVVDSRPSSRADALWDGTKLHVASRTSTKELRYIRLSYDSLTRKYGVDLGFPKTIAQNGFESAAIAKDTTGQLWTTFTQGSKVWVMNSSDAGASWSAPFQPPVAGTTVSSDDISSIIAFQGKIGVMWSNQATAKDYFVTHTDGAAPDTWNAVEVPLSGTGMADDHINLKNVESDSDGRLYAAVKTSQNEVGGGSDAPLAMLLVRSPAGSWTSHEVFRVQDDATRPILALDRENRRLYFMATAPVAGGTIHYKSTSVDDIRFEPGLGAPFMTWPGASLNNATTTKQPVDSDTGIVVMASDEYAGRYYHAEMVLPDRTAPRVTLTDPADGSSDTDTTPTFRGSAGQASGDSDQVTVRLYTGPEATGTPVQTRTATRQPDGAWSLDADPALENGSYTARAEQADAAGNAGRSSPHTFTVLPTRVTFKAVADTHVRQDQPSAAHGSVTSMRVSQAKTAIKRTYLRFNVEGLQGVKKATLRLYSPSGASSSGVDLRGSDNVTWDETTLTWQNAPPFGPSVFNTGGFPKEVWVTFDATQLVKGNGPVSLVLTTKSTIDRYFSSRDYGSSRTPELVVDQ
jgi:hypothetical protein